MFPKVLRHFLSCCFHVADRHHTPSSVPYYASWFCSQLLFLVFNKGAHVTQHSYVSASLFSLMYFPTRCQIHRRSILPVKVHPFTITLWLMRMVAIFVCCFKLNLVITRMRIYTKWWPSNILSHLFRVLAVSRAINFAVQPSTHWIISVSYMRHPDNAHNKWFY